MSRSPHSVTIRLLAVVISWLLCSGVGGVFYLNAADAETTLDDNPTLLATAGQSTIGDTSTYQQLTVPTTAKPAARATTARPSRPSAPVVPRQSNLEPIVEIGTIEIPKIGLVHRVMHGITMRNIDQGPSHWPGTPFPGENGNTVFMGHRVTKTHPFRHIDQAKAGDRVFFTIQGVRSAYSVTHSEVVTPNQVEHVVAQTPVPTATIFACHPPGSARYRYVVRMELVAG